MTVERYETLKGLIAELPGALVAYSGGADSAFLADVAYEVLGDRMVAVTAVSESLAPEERAQAAGVARARGWRHEEIRTHEIDRPESTRNTPDRSFHSTHTLFHLFDALPEHRQAPAPV